ncbi:MAG: metalloregulator ArsR/SmtB family transcription factor [bacterium]|nr:metalloregulator ArsR/SmtB family transcription factor [bacterium]
MDDAFKAIAEPRRRAILQLVQVDERSAGEIAQHFEVSRPAISQHLAVLLDAGLVEMRREGTKRMYRANIAQIQRFQAFWNEFWDVSLLRLKLDAEKRHRENTGAAKERRKGPGPGNDRGPATGR